jgi:hypothetical protein
MAFGTLDRIRFYLWCDTSSLSVDYVPPLSDYPEFPREEGVEFFFDRYKSALGSNYWTYVRGTCAYWNMNFVEVSDDCSATMGLICGSSFGYYPHIAIFLSPGIDNISLGSLLGNVTPRGTYFYENEKWEPNEVNFGLWNFKTNFRKEG